MLPIAENLRRVKRQDNATRIFHVHVHDKLVFDFKRRCHGLIERETIVFLIGNGGSHAVNGIDVARLPGNRIDVFSEQRVAGKGGFELLVDRVDSLRMTAGCGDAHEVHHPVVFIPVCEMGTDESGHPLKNKALEGGEILQLLDFPDPLLEFDTFLSVEDFHLGQACTYSRKFHGNTWLFKPFHHRRQPGRLFYFFLIIGLLLPGFLDHSCVFLRIRIKFFDAGVTA